MHDEPELCAPQPADLQNLDDVLGPLPCFDDNDDTVEPIEESSATEESQRSRRLQLGQLTGGRYVTANQAAYWDGKNQEGEVVASGTYFYTLKTDTSTFTQKMIILK